MFQRSTSPQSPHTSTTEFLKTLFRPQDLLELRSIESWSDGGKRHSRLVDRRWLTADSLPTVYPTLKRLNEQGANIFFGVNPRRRQGSKKVDVACCHTLWADLDDARPDNHQRWQMLPPPSLIVDSGRGVHLYWRLTAPVALDTVLAQRQVESILRGMYRHLAADCVHDVSRLLRLPGFANIRDFRSGQPTAICQLAECHANRCYPLDDFQRFAGTTLTDRGENPVGLRLPAISTGCHLVGRIRGLVQLLTRDVVDRSKRDFFVVMKLLELGCSPDEVAAIVADHSKFCGNPAYLERTLYNALRTLEQRR